MKVKLTPLRSEMSLLNLDSNLKLGAVKFL